MKYFKSLSEILYKLRYMLTQKQKRLSIVVMITIILGSFMELLGVSAILPFIEAILTPDEIQGSWYGKIISTMLGVENSNIITVVIGIIIIIVYIIKNIYLYFSVMLQTVYRSKIQKYLSTKMLKSYMQRSYEDFIKINTSEVIRGIGTDITGVYNLMDNLFRFTGEFLTALLIGGFIIFTDVSMAISIIGIAGGCFVVIIVGLKNKTRYLGEQKRITDTARGNCAYQAIMGFKEIKVTQTTDFFVEAYEQAYEKQRVAEVRNEYITNIPEKLIEAMCVAALLGIICLKIAIGSDMTIFIPKLAVFALAAFRLLPSVSRMTRYMNGVIFNNAFLQSAYQNLKEIEQYTRDKKEADITVSYDQTTISFEKEITVNNISWNYQGNERKILSNLSLTIKKGESIGLIGVSGAGKTTLADIILGLMSPREGTILMDGMDISTNPKGWSRIISYVPQNIFLSDDTIRNNVAFGCPDNLIKDEDIWSALREAQMEEYVRGLPEQLDTQVGERGIKFSGGQRQRIAIARALYKKPEVIVLDEATSALDNETEKAVMESIEVLQGHKTLIIVAHRLTTIKNCDRIYEITEGKAKERSWDDVNSEIECN